MRNGDFSRADGVGDDDWDDDFTMISIFSVFCCALKSSLFSVAINAITSYRASEGAESVIHDDVCKCIN